MVESIFGGKSAYPFSGNERNIFHPRLADRRLSVPTTHLKTISETGDDSTSSSTSASTEAENAAIDGPTFYRRPRTMSLPAIYRDGSYLRIRRSSNTLSPCKRRYSEPGAITAQHIIHRLSLRSSGSNESENNSDKRPSVKSMEATYSIRESGFPDFAGPRRHSDPMHYITENVDQLGISKERPGKPTTKLVKCPSVKTLSGTIKARQPRNDNEQTAQTAVVRRRKSSLVPVPFNSVQQHSKACNTQSVSGRPRSFPPSKQDGKRQCNLPELKTAFLTGHVADRTDPFDWNNNKEHTLESEESKEDKYAANADILVQWMKFFG